MNNRVKFKGKQIILLFCIILGIMAVVTSSTYAYLYYTGTNSSITGNMGKVDLDLNVTRVLPVDETVNSILIFQFKELADNLNAGCIDKDGDYSLCQLYKINLKNKNGGVNTKVKGSLAFNNATMPNLSWILLGNTYSSSTNYTSSMLGNSFNTASSTYNSFVDDYLLRNGDEISFYILVWVNEIDKIQYDRGSYTGVVRFEDHNGNGVTAEFGDTGDNNNRYNAFASSIMKPVAKVDTDLDFSVTSYDGQTNGIYLNDESKDALYPIYYYRGQVDNNLIFAGFCWKVIRTTETGGLKILYNGVVSNEQCNNNGDSTKVATNSFNDSYASPAYLGYMYGNLYTNSSKTMNSDTTTYKYGNDVKYENGVYTLNTDKTIISSSSWSSIYNTGLNNTHYTCFSTGTTCSEVYYIHSTSSTTAYYFKLSGGKKIDDILNEMLDYNQYSSKIKGSNTISKTLDYWYYTNLATNYSDYLEDTVWCNDRSISNLGGFDPNGGSMSDMLTFTPVRRLISTANSSVEPDFSCSRSIDRFTVSSSNGNGDLSYPVGLLTADEVIFAGGKYGSLNNTFYLYDGNAYWTMSPNGFSSQAGGMAVNSDGSLVGALIISKAAIRPVISLKFGFELTGNGNGTTTNPYVVG